MMNSLFFRFGIVFFLLLIISFSAIQTNAFALPKEINVDLAAQSACVVEKESNRVLYGKDIHKKLPMASLTKIFTALTVLDNVKNLDEVVLVDDRAVGIEGTSIYLRKGEKLTVKELLYGMMLPSGNDAAAALGFYLCDNLEEFCKLMNKSAKNAGALNSSFKNAHGLDENEHFTTAYDLAVVSAKAMKNKTFAEIVSTKRTKISGNDEIEVRYLRNKNKLLNIFDGCNGIKTGFTDNAGRCCVSSAIKDNTEVICVVLNCPNMFEDCAKLMNLALSEYKTYELLSCYTILKCLPVENGKVNEVKLFTKSGFSIALSEKEFININYVYDLPTLLEAPVKKEQVVGKVNIYLGSELLFESDVFTTDSVRADNYFETIKDVISNW